MLQNSLDVVLSAFGPITVQSMDTAAVEDNHALINVLNKQAIETLSFNKIKKLTILMNLY